MRKMRKRKKIKKIKLLAKFSILIIIIIIIVKNINIDKNVKNLYSQEKVYNYLKNEKNQKTVLSAAVDLNSGNSENACVYFLSEVLRKNNLVVPKEVCNTGQLISYLEKSGWEKDANYKELSVGDICFTTDANGDKKGTPSHTYIFMGWVKEDNYEYAYICDNQAKNYKNKVYHIRNIKGIDKVNGYTKEAFSFFMKIQ